MGVRSSAGELTIRATTLGETMHIAFRLMMFLALLPLTWACKERPAENGPTELRKVSIGIQVSPAMALPMLAKERGLFAAEGLDVELKPFTAGKFALQAFIGGSIDYAVSGEVPVCLATLQGNDLRVVTQVVERTVNEVRVVARRDPEARDGRDYFIRKKRKLATSFGGGPEFYTYSLMNHYGIRPSEVEIVSQKPEDMPAALESGSVDAISVFDPFAFIAERRLGDRGVTYTAPEVYSEFYVLNARPEQLERDRVTIEAVLRALLKAAELAASDPEGAQAVVVQYTKLDPAVVKGIWGNFVFRPAITQALLDTWAAEERWARETGKIEQSAPPADFGKVLAPELLRKIAPQTVHLSTPQ